MEAATQTTARRWAREYETIYILHPRITPEDAKKVADRMSETVDRLKGQLTRVDNWGKRRLAYKIKKETRGIFIYLRYLGYSDLVAELERNLRLFDNVLRFQTVLVRDRVKPEDVQVDPEEVKFAAIELTEEDEEPSLAEQLGMVQPERAAPVAAEGEDAEGEAKAEGAEGEAKAESAEGADGAEAAPATAEAAPAEGEEKPAEDAKKEGES